MTSVFVSIISILISISTFIIVLIKYFEDRPRIDIHCEVRGFKDEKFIRIVYVNVGRRTTCIKRIGYFDWSMGSYICEGIVDFESVLKEGEFGKYELKMEFKDFWRVKCLFVEDYHGNIWKTKENQMDIIHRIGHADIIPKPEISEKMKLFDEKKCKESIRKYIEFLKRKKYDEIQYVKKNILSKINYIV